MIAPDFVRRLKASGFGERIYVEFRNAEAGTGDRVRIESMSFAILLTRFLDLGFSVDFSDSVPSQGSTNC